jgi:hypothetical protein
MPKIQIDDHVLTESQAAAVAYAIARVLSEAENVDAWTGLGPHGPVRSLREVADILDQR